MGPRICARCVRWCARCALPGLFAAPWMGRARTPGVCGASRSLSPARSGVEEPLEDLVAEEGELAAAGRSVGGDARLRRPPVPHRSPAMRHNAPMAKPSRTALHERSKRTPSQRRWTAVPWGPMAFERITADPERMGGVPCIRDLRVTVSMVLGQLAAGRTTEQLLEDYPYLEREDVHAALEYAAAVVNEREVPVAKPA